MVWIPGGGFIEGGQYGGGEYDGANLVQQSGGEVNSTRHRLPRPCPQRYYSPRIHLTSRTTQHVHTFGHSFSRAQVIVVSIQYRVGSLGFLYHPSAGIRGNLGLMDQRLALQVRAWGPAHSPPRCPASRRLRGFP